MPEKFTPHGHFCELDMFHRKNKKAWRENCFLGKRPKHPACKECCDYCEHCVMVTFEDSEMLKANEIIRLDIEE